MTPTSSAQTPRARSSSRARKALLAVAHGQRSRVGPQPVQRPSGRWRWVRRARSTAAGSLASSCAAAVMQSVGAGCGSDAVVTAGVSEAAMCDRKFLRKIA